MKNKKRVLLTFICIVGMGVIITLFINLYMVLSVKKQVVSIDEISKEYDAILILGCKVNGDSPSLMLVKRLEKGIDVYNKTHKKIIVSGDNTRNDYDEVNTMENYLISSNVPKEDIIKDYAGINTYDSLYRLKEIFGVKKVIIVTQKFHLYRSLYIANKLDIEAIGIVADDIPQKFIMLKNQFREILSRDKNFFKVIFKPKSKILGEKIDIFNYNNLVNE